jgi:hypothetical protein
MLLLALTASSTSSTFKPATVSWGKEPMKLSSTGPSSTLPAFFFMAKNEEGGDIWTGYNYTGGVGVPIPFKPSTTCPEDVFDNTMEDLRVPKLPWRLQEDWGCERNQTEVDVLVIENPSLRAAVTTQWGGKVWSLYHKGQKKQLFFNNPAHQPANIGYLKAWASGGAEWNWAPGKIGHSAFTESPVWTAVLPSKLGPVVRVYEYDRLNGTVWQVDILVVNETMWAHPKITNPHPVELPGYWWTCVAMPVDSPTTRVLAPSKLWVGFETCAAWPNGGLGAANTSFRGIDAGGCRDADDGRGTCAWQDDLSYLGNIPHSNDFFMHIDRDQAPWIAHTKDDGWTVVHSHPRRLNGTKFFQWGYNEFGFWNEDFLSGTETDVEGCNPDAYDPWCPHIKHEGGYTELQVGPARTQMHTFPLPAAETSTPSGTKGEEAKEGAAQSGASRTAKLGAYEWTEWFKALQGDPKVLQGADYSKGLDAIDTWLKSADGVSDATVDQVDEVLKALADVTPTAEQIVSKGMPWGGLQQKLLAKLAKLSGASDADAAVAAALAPGCPFPEPPITDETRPWLELLETGTFSNATLSSTPVNFEVSDGWVELLDRSVSAGHTTWLHYLFLATHALEVGNAELGRKHLERSMALRPSVHAARNLALLAPTLDSAAASYHTAWALWEKLDDTKDTNVPQLGADLSSEFSAWLMGNKRWDELDKFFKTLHASGSRTASFLIKDRVLHARAALAVERGDYKTALPILRGNCFPTYGNMRSYLIDLWYQAQVLKEVDAKGGASLTTVETLRLRKRLRCDGDNTGQKIDSKCVNGPPNLGYAY